MAEDPAEEGNRLEVALRELRQGIDEMLARETVSHAGAHRDVLEHLSRDADPVVREHAEWALGRLAD